MYGTGMIEIWADSRHVGHGKNDDIRADFVVRQHSVVFKNRFCLIPSIGLRNCGEHDHFMCTWSGSKPDYAVKLYANLVFVLNSCNIHCQTPHISYPDDL